MENPSKSEDIDYCGGGWKNRMITKNRQKSNAKKKQQKKTQKSPHKDQNNVHFLNGNIVLICIKH